MMTGKQKSRKTGKQENRKYKAAIRLISCFSVFLLFAAPAVAMTPATLIDAQLRSRSVLVSALRDGSLSFFDDERTLRVLGAGEFVRLRFEAQAAADEEAAMEVVLTDGRRLRGRMTGVEEGGQTLRWRHPALIQEAKIDLEEIEVLWLAGKESAERAAATEDRVVLANGDVLEGFVAAVSMEAIWLQMEDGAEAQALPLERIAHVVFANAPQSRPRELHRVILADGSELWARDLAIESGQLAMRGALPGREDLLQNVPLAQVRQVDVVGGDAVLMELVEQDWRVTGGGEVFGRAMVPHVRQGVLHLHAPVRVAVTTPAGATRLAAYAVLDVMDEHGERMSGAEWADLELIVRHNGRELARHHLHIERPQVRFNVALNDAENVGELVIELEVGANGPIMDRLKLPEAVLLVRQR